MKAVVIIFAILCVAVVVSEVAAQISEKHDKEDYDNEPNKDERR